MRTTNHISRLTFYVLRLTLFASVALSAACRAPQDEDETSLTASGFIEGQEVTVAPETQGLIAEIFVSRGDTVAAGDVVLRLDDATLQSQREEAEAALSATRANLDRVLAGTRPEDVAAARASLEEARANRDGAQQAVLNARDVISNPLSLQAQIDEAHSQIALARQNVELQEAELEETKIKRNLYADQGGDTARSWDLQLQASEAKLARARAELAGARMVFGILTDMRENPLSLKAELHRAEADLEQAQGRVREAEAKLAELEAGPTEEDVALAEAQVSQAQAGVRLVDARLDQLTLYAPMDGIVSTRSAQVGETVTAGKPLLTIANLDEVTLVLYIPENRIGQVEIGHEVEVTVDSFPERIFTGRVSSIAGEAEFTPRHVQTTEERVNLVFAVDVTIPNPDHALKPGMPADATIVP